MLPVVTDARAQRHASLGEGVADVAAGNLLREAHVALARDLGHGVAAAVVDGQDLISREGRGRPRGILAVGKAELELVLAAHAVGEVAAVHVDVVPGLAGGEVEIGSKGLVEVVVDPRVQAALAAVCPRVEAVAPAVVGVFGIEVEVRAEGVVPLRLPQAVEAAGHAATVLGIEVPLVPQEAGGLVGDHARVAPDLDLGPVEPEQRQHVVAAGLPVQLGVPVLQQGLVLGLREARDADVVLAVRSPERPSRRSGRCGGPGAGRP